MEFLEGFEEDDSPELLQTTPKQVPSSSSAGLQSLLNPDPQAGSARTSNEVNAATSTTQQQQQQQQNGENLDGSDDDDIMLTGFSQGTASSSSQKPAASINGSSSGQHGYNLNGAQRQQQASGPSTFQCHVPYQDLPQAFPSFNSSMRPSADNQSASTSSAAATAVRPSSLLSQSNGSYDYLSSPYGTNQAGSSLGRIPIIGAAGASGSGSVSGSRTPGTPYGSSVTPNSTAAAGPYGSSFPYTSAAQGPAMPQASPASLQYPRQSYFGNQSYAQHSTSQSPYDSSSTSSFHHPLQVHTPSGLASPNIAFGVPGLAGSGGSYRIGAPTQAPSASTYSYAGNSQSNRQLGQQSRSNGSSAIIDLTEFDDNDTGSASNNEYGGASTSVNSGASDDDIKISSEKLHVKAPEEDEDDDLELVGERPNEATNPVCIGQLSGVALILYPIAELCPQREKTLFPPTSSSSSSSSSLTAPPPLSVALLRTTSQMPSSNGNETIKLYSAQTWENFGVVEHRIANVLGPIMTKDNRRGMGVWVEAKVMRTKERSPMMLPLVMLLFCHPHLVKAVAQILEKSAIYLEHPPSYDPAMHGGFKYSNPHGGAITASAAAQRKQQVMNGFQSSYGTSAYSAGLAGGSRYGGGQAGKSVEVQREQVEEMFKSIQSGADLGEAEPSEMLNTKLYPHQKQALAFLLDRERLRTVEGVLARKNAKDEKSDSVEDELISLWRPRKDLYGRFIGWQHVVTEVEIGSDRPPPQCRGAILADDMGLGKTLVIIALIAGTMNEAKAFASQPPVKDRGDRESFDALAAHPMGKPVSLSEFKSPLYGQTGGSFSSYRLNSDTGKGGKKKKESKTQKKREDAEAARLEKLQMRSRGTLIVCPLSTVVNWESQIEEHVGLAGRAVTSKKKKCDKSRSSTPADGLSIYIYHGNNRTTDLAELASYDVVLTTFSTLGSEYSRQSRKEEQDEEGAESSESGIEELDKDGQPVKQKGKKRKRKKIEGDAVSPLQQIEWFRIVLDEAHMIKEHSTIQARAACELMAERRVCLTGTPLQNTLNDLFSLMRFLRLEPFTDRTMWTNYIGAPAKVGDPLGVSRLQLLMRHLALRRTKQTKDKEGKPILEIPDKKDELRYVTLDEQERAFYISHHRRYKHNFEMLEKNDTLLKNYCSILQEVLRLRQICAHMALVRDSEDRADALKGEDGGDVVSAIKAHGLSKPRALRLLALMRDTGAAQCDECGQELAPGGLDTAQDTFEEDANKKPRRIKGIKKEKSNGTVKTESEETVKPSAPTPVLTRCQHLFCLECFQKNVAINFPDAVTANDRAACSVCKEEISPVIDAIQVSSSEIDTLGSGDGDEDTTSAGCSRHVVEHSTKIRQLVSDLFPLSQNNPASANYAGDAVDLSVCDEDPKFRPQPREATKTVVFSQWTKLLDRCEDGLRECNIKFERLEGSMNRAERSRALANFKNDLSCEVFLVSLRAGGVGLNLTHASRAYLMEPSWNPSVENQAIDRVHRIGQTRPVKTVRLIVKDSIEANMLEIQKRKAQLANMSLSQTLSKAQLAERRLEDLRTLFK